MTTRKTDDADLDDLLAEDDDSLPLTLSHHRDNALEMTPLNLDHLTRDKVGISTSAAPSSPLRSNPTNQGNCLELLHGSCTYLAYAHPRLCCSCALLGIASLLFVLLTSIMNPTLYYGNVHEEDFLFSKSKFDLTQSKIDHWCLAGNDDSCRCEDPLVPTSRGEFATWTKAHHQNKELLNSKRGNDIQVAFVGESLVEEMAGRWMGTSRGIQLEGMSKMFNEHFSADSGVEGIALGIAGDTSPNVLWRLLHGEMPDWFVPDVWWVSLGMNDLGRMQCSEEVVVIGILRVVEEILEKRPQAQVVVNSMLPMADLRGGIYPHVRDYKDSFKGNDKASHYVKKQVMMAQEKETPEKRLLKRGKNNVEQEEGEDANNPEKLDKKTLKRYNRKDPVNPIIDPNETKMKKFQLFKKNRLPLWTSIYAINKSLRKFCDSTDRVTFFDATSIFAERVDRGRFMLKSDMISIRGHPTPEGFRKWEDKMVKKLQTMLADEAKEEKKKEVVKYEIADAGDDDKKGSSSSSSSSMDDKDVQDSSASESSDA